MREYKIRELLRIVSESDVDELEIHSWWRKIKIKKNSGQVTVAAPVVAPQIVSSAPTTPTASAPATAASESTPAPDTTPDNTIEIKAPMVGTYYSSPAPDSDPYIKEGDTISEGQVLCIVEAMKLMNEIEAEVSGKIVKILVENAQAVEYNQPMFLVEPN